jgi:hypothetical protein
VLPAVRTCSAASNQPRVTTARAGGGRVVEVDHVAEASRLGPNQRRPALEQRQQPDGEVGWEPAGQPDELAARDDLATPKLGEGRPELGLIGWVQAVKGRSRQTPWVH